MNIEWNERMESLRSVWIGLARRKYAQSVTKNGESGPFLSAHPVRKIFVLSFGSCLSILR